MTPLDLDKFFAQQLSKWHVCAKRYKELNVAERRIIALDGRDYTLIHNPLRTASVTARIEKDTQERQCPLCRANRPQEQEDITIRPDGSNYVYHLAVNPFPILTHHFTIISDQHSRQTITPERLNDMVTLARHMQDYLLFFNGASSGASAPDHFHFQAVRQVDVPLLGWNTAAMEGLFVQICEAEKVKIDFDNSDMTNILCWNKDGKLHWIVINRLRHRPQQYNAEGIERVIISPASLEFAGIIPIIREEDFTKMTPKLLADILNQCYDNEPLVDVGLCTNEARVTPNPDGTTTIQGVTIGKRFHWEQQKTFTYEGKILTCADKMAEGKWLINRVKAEKYLHSVITSEMSATSNLPLLKAHAVISRSWLVRQMNRKHNARKDKVRIQKSTTPTQEHEIVRWYDAKAHLSFDVCADDHCQRYQGISAKVNPLVDQAIRETRGEVLVYKCNVIDARYSKCCGGRTEEYNYCWENIHLPYLTSIPDVREDGSVLCNTRDKTILNQVLNEYDQATDDFYEWKMVYTQAELSDIIEQKGGFKLGKITDLIAIERGRSGRISRLQIVGENGTIVVGKELEIRRMLSKTHLYSSNFEVTTTQDSDSNVIFTLKGRGWGHGVGLCQIGAAVMGAEGCDYKTILSHYYKGATLMRIW